VRRFQPRRPREVPWVVPWLPRQSGEPLERPLE
jgi:hypothetical protein